MTTATQNLVRIFSSADWASYYGEPEKVAEEIEDILNRPCPFNSRKQVLDTHFAFMGMPAINGDPLTVAKWLELHPADGQPRFYFANNPWHAGQPHTDLVTLEPRLYITLREIVPGSTYKAPDDQVAMLPEGYEMPTTIEEVTKSVLVYRKTGKRSNPNRYAACRERTIKTATASAGDVSCVGFFDGHGLYVFSWDGDRDNYVGVGASRILKLESSRT